MHKNVFKLHGVNVLVHISLSRVMSEKQNVKLSQKIPASLRRKYFLVCVFLMINVVQIVYY